VNYKPRFGACTMQAGANLLLRHGFFRRIIALFRPGYLVKPCGYWTIHFRTPGLIKIGHYLFFSLRLHVHAGRENFNAELLV
jgi:hypothetical protein